MVIVESLDIIANAEEYADGNLGKSLVGHLRTVHWFSLAIILKEVMKILFLYVYQRLWHNLM